MRLPTHNLRLGTLVAAWIARICVRVDTAWGATERPVPGVRVAKIEAIQARKVRLAAGLSQTEFARL